MYIHKYIYVLIYGLEFDHHFKTGELIQYIGQIKKRGETHRQEAR